MSRISIILALLTTPALAEDCGLYEAIEPGDTLGAIAARCDTTVDALFAANPGIDATQLQIGSALKLTPEATDMGGEARQLYQTAFLGHYAPVPNCVGQEFQVFLEETQVTTGETTCDIAGYAIEGDGLRLSLVRCLGEGEPAEDRVALLHALPGEALNISVAGRTTWRLERCVSP